MLQDFDEDDDDMLGLMDEEGVQYREVINSLFASYVHFLFVILSIHDLPLL